MVKGLVTALCAMLCLPMLSAGQQTLSSKDMVAITPLLARELQMPVDAKRVLQQKLNQIVTQNGFGSHSGMFVLTANAVTTDKRVTASAPAKYVVELEVSFYVVNVLEQLVVDEISFTIRGIENSETRAIARAITQINSRSSTIRRFMSGCREKIVEYYNTRIPTLLDKAKSFASMQDYETALMILASIPDNVDQYPVVADQMVAIHTRMLDRDAASAIQQAKAKIALRDYEGAMDYLVSVDPASSGFRESSALIENIKNTIDEKERAELARQMQIYEDRKETARRAHEDSVELEKLRIASAREVGIEQASAGSTIVGGLLDMLGSWFLKAIF